MREPRWLNEFAENVHSQYGEDGIIAKCLELLPSRNGWAIDVGAGDGVSLSNTMALYEAGMRSLCVECNEDGYRCLAHNRPEDHNVCGYAGWEGDEAVDAIAARFPDVPGDPDFMSLDIDGNDWHVWKAMALIRPKVMCIEYNPTMHGCLDYVQRASKNVKIGSSLDATYRLGREKGYRMVAVTTTNAVFVDRRYEEPFNTPSDSPLALRGKDSTDWIRYVFCGYDGETYCMGNIRHPWASEVAT